MEVNLPDDLFGRLLGFAPLYETIVGDGVEPDELAAVVLARGLDQMLLDAIGEAEAHVTLAAMQELAARAPPVVYGYVAEMFQSGAEIERQRAKERVVGFPATQTDEPASAQ
jgi:hypothetical protein